MPFPIAIADSLFETPRALASEVMRRAVAGTRPDRDIAHAAREGALSREEALGLCAALIQTGQPATVATGARLAEELGDPAMGKLLLLAHNALDMGTLLQAADATTSVEDLLLSAAATLVGDDATLRADLLVRVRHAGLGAVETRVLAKHGTANEIAHALPGVIVEGLPPGTEADIAQSLLRGDDVADAVLAVVVKLPRALRDALWAEISAQGVDRTIPNLKERVLPEQ